METLHSNKLASGGKKGPSTLRFVDVQEIQDGIVLLKDGSLRSILATSSINFALKSSEEQEAIIGQYQNFLNSLDFPLEIVIHSRKLNIKPYIELLEKQQTKQTSELLRMQISEYTNFIANLTNIAHLMTKQFYLITPFFPIETSNKGLLDRFFSVFNPEKIIVHRQEELETYKSQLYQRVDHVTAGLSGIGLKLVPLETEEIIELLYNSYNPNLFATNIIKDIESLELKK